MIGAGIYLTGYSVLKLMAIGLYDTLGEVLFLGAVFTIVGLILNELTQKEKPHEV